MEDTKPMLKCNNNGCGGGGGGEGSRLPESPRLPMEFLSRSWSLSALQLSKALSHSLPSLVSKSGMISSCATPPILEEDYATAEEESMSYPFAHLEDHHHSNKPRHSIAGNSFSFASSVTSQLVLERIMCQSEVSPLTSGRPSCSDPLPLGNGGQSCGSIIDQLPLDSPDPLSPPHHRDFDYKFLSYNSTPRLQIPTIRVGPTNPNGAGGGGGGGSSKTVGRWLKERREKKKEEARVQNAQLHAAVSVAAVAAAVAATAAATASASAGKDEQATLTDVAMASAATLVAARCVEAAEAMGAEHGHLASVISSAVNVQSHGDIMTLTAAAATALRGAATLKARAMKEVCNIAAVLPVAVEKGLGVKAEKSNCFTRSGHSSCGLLEDHSFVGLCNEELLARGSELLKRTRTGELHSKLVSVYINKEGQVILKMKSRHVAGTLTKKKKKVLSEVCSNMPAWPERYHIESGEDRCYFGLKTATNRVIQFECKNQKEHDIWTQGVSRLLSLAREKSKLHMRNLSIGSST